MVLVADDLCDMSLIIGFNLQAAIDGTQDAGRFFPGASRGLRIGFGHCYTHAPWRETVWYISAQVEAAQLHFYGIVCENYAYL